MNYIHLRRGANGRLGSYHSFDLFDRTGRYVGNDALDKGGATLVYAHDPKTGLIKISVAHCRFNDSYSRKKGRATAQLGNNVFFLTVKRGKLTGRQVFDIVSSWSTCL